MVALARDDAIVVVVVDEGAVPCKPGPVVGGSVVVELVPLVVGGAGDIDVVVVTGWVVAVVEEVLMVVVGMPVIVNPPPGLGSTITPCEDVAASVLTASHSTPRPTNRTNSNTVERRILIRSETGPRMVDTKLRNFDIN